MANYSTYDDVYLITGLTSEVISTSNITSFISKADKGLLSFLAINIRNEELTGDIDGSNKEFFTKYHPIADIDFDKVVDKNDIKVYTWTDMDDEDTKTEVTVSSVNPITGRILLVNSPPSDVEIVTIDYYYYKQEIDWDLVSLASAQYAGYLAVASEFYLVPERFALGSLRITHEYPQRELWRAFISTLNQIRSGMASKKRSSDMVLKREELR